MTLLCYCWNLFTFTLVSISGQFWPFIPNHQCFYSLLIIVALCWRTCAVKWTIGTLIALLSVTAHSQVYAKKVKLLFQAGENITINGRVDSFCKQITHGSEYSFRVDAINGEEVTIWAKPVVRLIVPENVSLAYGERWSLSVRLRPVYGRLNEAGFDQERYFISQKWAAKGIVTDGVSIKLADSSSLRSDLHEIVKEHTIGLSNQALLLALSFGDRNGIDPQIWQQLKNSGLSHLIAISGLHIGIAFFLGWQFGRIVRLIWSSSLFLPIIAGLTTAFAYSWLAGFSITTQRAFIMCLILSLLTVARLNFSPFFKLLVTISILLALDPFSAMSASFWLSFTAVSSLFILINMPFFIALSGAKKLVVTQLALVVIMLPVTALTFGGFSVLAPVYNLWAVPYFSFVVIPCIFLALLSQLVSDKLSSQIWYWSDVILAPVEKSLSFSQAGWVNIASYAVWPMILVLVLCILKALIKWRYKLVVLLILVGWITFRPEDRGWRVDVLDVGQGLAVLIEKSDKHFLYDTGIRWQGGSVAQSIIEPVLRGRGVNQLDGLILSHMDSDHAGGKEYLEKAFQPVWKLASQSMENYEPCIEGELRYWQGLTIEALWPPRQVRRAYNPHSCVLKISDGFTSVLLSGDIDKISEFLLVKRGRNLDSEIMLVPHHGSATSSSDALIHAISPNVAIASLAKGNQWGMPHRSVYQRYQSHQVEWLDTGDSGQISILINSAGWKIEKIRENQSVAWYRQMLRNGVE